MDSTSGSLPSGPADYIAETLPRVLELLQQSDVRELELHEGEVRVRLHRVAAPELESLAPALGELEGVPVEEPEITEIRSPLVGTFYRAGKPGMPPLVSEGSYVENDSVVGIIEALQILTEVEAGCVGTVTKVLVTDGQPVEYGQLLFEVTTSG